MCGILGSVNYNNIENFSKSLDLINYRGPDHTGIKNIDNVLFGHNRLAIIDLDSRSNQPFIDNGTNTMIVYNGEIYNYLSLKEDLKSEGVVFNTNSDTEVILKSYQKWGVESFKKLHGMFAFAILDKINNTVVFARDRMGEKPFYYYHSKEKFIFGSEIKAIKNMLDSTALNEEALIDYLSFGYIPSPKTIYKEIKKLSPGYYGILELDTLSIKLEEFYKLEFKNNIKSEEYARNLIDEACNDIAKEIGLSDVGYGVFLSGGVDSSGVSAYMKQINQNLESYTMVSDDEQFDESQYANKVAKHLNIKNVLLNVNSNDVENIYDNMVTLFDEPFNDFSFIPTYYTAREAKRFNTVVVTGDGADEVFCGYSKYARLAKLNKIHRFKRLRKIVKFSSNLLSDSSDYKRQLFRIGLEDDELIFDLLAIVFKERELKNIAGPRLLKAMKNYSSFNVIKEHLKNIKVDSMIQKLRYIDIKLTLAEDMLVKVDRTSMLNSLETRAFFLHPKILEVAFQLDDSLLVKHDINKYILKKNLESYLPHDILYRQKMGFGIPLKKYIFKELKQVFKESISHLPHKYFNHDEINKIIDMQKKGKRDFIMQLHALMFLGRWFKTNGFNIEDVND